MSMHPAWTRRALLGALPAAAVLLLWGCAAPGIILQMPPAQPGAAAFLTVPQRDNVWVIPVKAKNLREIAITAEGLWVTEGWFTVEFQCFFPKNHPDKAVVSAGTAGKPYFMQAGRRYALQCDDEKAGVIDLVDLGSTADFSKAR